MFGVMKDRLPRPYRTEIELVGLGSSEAHMQVLSGGGNT